jgi:dipeptidyl aminopeptidase/acylaminoacyl peptidase
VTAPDGSQRLYVIDDQGRSLREVSDGLVNARSASWSPDGAAIVFHASRSPNEKTGIWTVAPDGGGLAELVGDDQWNQDPQWSPDGSWISYTKDVYSDELIGRFLAVVSADGTTHRIFGTEQQLKPYEHWWIDHERIVFLATVGETGPFGVYVVDVGTGVVEDLALELPPNYVLHSASPDGRHLVAGPVGLAPAPVLIIETDTRQIDELDLENPTAYYSWSPDSTAFAQRVSIAPDDPILDVAIGADRLQRTDDGYLFGTAIFDLETKQLHIVSAVVAEDIAWSGDADRLALLTSWPSDGFTIVSTDGSSREVVLDPLAEEDDEWVVELDWTPALH